MVGSGLAYLPITILLLTTQAFLLQCVAHLCLTSGHMDRSGLGCALAQSSAVFQAGGEGLCNGIVDHSARMKMLQRHCAPPFLYQTPEAMVPTDVRISPGVSGWRKGKAEAWCQSEVDPGAQKRFHTVLMTCHTGA